MTIQTNAHMLLLRDTCGGQHRIPEPMAMKVPNVPPPWSITLPTLLMSSLPLIPYLRVF
jgi:hypothetical protein